MSDYPHLGVPLPLELVNTRFASGGQPVDGLATPDDLDAWLAANADLFAADLFAADRPRSPFSTPARLERFRQVRAALYRLLSGVVDAAAPAPADVQLLNALAAAAPHYPHLRLDSDGTYGVRTVECAESLDDALLASVARAAMELLTSLDRERLRRCGGPGCVLLFLRERRRREWCSDACGNRARVARHYDQHRRQPVKKEK